VELSSKTNRQGLLIIGSLAVLAMMVVVSSTSSGWLDRPIMGAIEIADSAAEWLQRSHYHTRQEREETWSWT
jgi:hypothetical protein